MNDLIELKDVTPDRWVHGEIHGETRAYASARARAPGFRWRRPAVVAGALALTALAGWGVNAQIASSRRLEAQLQAQAEALTARRVAASTAAHENEIKSLRDEVRHLRADLHAAELKHKADEARALHATAGALDKKIAASRADVSAAIARVSDKIDKTKQQADRAASAKIDRTPVGSIAPDKSLTKTPPKTARAPAPAQPHVARQSVEDGASDYANGLAPRLLPRDAPPEFDRLRTLSRRDEFVVVEPGRGRFIGEPDAVRSFDRRRPHVEDRYEDD